MATVRMKTWELAIRLELAGRLVIGGLMLLFTTNLGSQTMESLEKVENAVSRRYRNFVLGMSSNEVKDNLALDNWFDYRGDPDLSLLQRPRASVIDTEGTLFISRALFQFEDDSLISIVLELNLQTLDWYTVYSALENKYGTPSNLSPSRIVWEDTHTRLTMEKPLTVKYLDRTVFEAALEEDSNRKAWLAQARGEFLDEF